MPISLPSHPALWKNSSLMQLAHRAQLLPNEVLKTSASTELATSVMTTVLAPTTCTVFSKMLYLGFSAPISLRKLLFSMSLSLVCSHSISKFVFESVHFVNTFCVLA